MGDRSIVERLRSALLYEGWGGESELPELAADEIERLRAALHRIIDLDHHNMGPEARATKVARAALNGGE